MTICQSAIQTSELIQSIEKRPLQCVETRRLAGRGAKRGGP
jgi:hypothetical protein